MQLTLGLLPLPCRYSETITVGEGVASIIFYWQGCVCAADTWIITPALSL